MFKTANSENTVQNLMPMGLDFQASISWWMPAILPETVRETETGSPATTPPPANP
jgi:hypothetical protein